MRTSNRCQVSGTQRHDFHPYIYGHGLSDKVYQKEGRRWGAAELYQFKRWSNFRNLKL